MRISNSFSEGEIQVLDFILTTLLRGGSPQMATRNKDFASLCRKVVAMKTRAQQKEREDARRGRDRSSVGDVAAPDSDEQAIDASIEDVG